MDSPPLKRSLPPKSTVCWYGVGLNYGPFVSSHTKCARRAHVCERVLPSRFTSVPTARLPIPFLFSDVILHIALKTPGAVQMHSTSPVRARLLSKCELFRVVYAATVARAPVQRPVILKGFATSRVFAFYLCVAELTGACAMSANCR